MDEDVLVFLSGFVPSSFSPSRFAFFSATAKVSPKRAVGGTFGGVEVDVEAESEGVAVVVE